MFSEKGSFRCIHDNGARNENVVHLLQSTTKCAYANDLSGLKQNVVVMKYDIYISNNFSLMGFE